jgi:hypothetical protein
VPGGQVPPDVPELLEVVGGGALGGLDAEGRVSTGAVAPLVGQLGPLRESEEGLGVGQGPVDQGLVQSVVGHHGEAVALEGAAEVPGETLRIGVEQGQGDGRDGGGHGELLIPSWALSDNRSMNGG